MFVIIHFPEGALSVLPSVLDCAEPLKVVPPEDGEPVEPGTIYAAPPGFHLLVEDAGGPLGRVRLGRGPKENHHRPAADPPVPVGCRRARTAGGRRGPTPARPLRRKRRKGLRSREAGPFGSGACARFGEGEV